MTLTTTHRKQQQQQQHTTRNLLHHPPPPPNSKKKLLLLLSIAAIFFSLLVCLLFFSLSSSSSSSSLILNLHHHFPNKRGSSSWIQPEIIRQACKATRYPDTCQSTFLLFQFHNTDCIPLNPPSRKNPNSLLILSFLQSYLCFTSHNLKSALSMVRQILDSSSPHSPNRHTAATNCIEILTNSDHRISSSAEALAQRGRRRMNKDARAWMSAALAYNYDCWSVLKYVNDSQLIAHTMSFLDTKLIVYCSNALSMIAAYDIYGPDPTSWRPPRTERDGFWEEQPAALNAGGGGGFPTHMRVDVTVCSSTHPQVQGCDFNKVQEAVDAAPARDGDSSNLKNNKFVIWIKEGVYDEIVRVPLDKRNVVFLGDGIGKTVITGSLNAGHPGVSTYNSATVGVLGDGFMARGITFQNTAGPDVHQAVAFRSDSDLSVIDSCEFLGNQDTLYAHSLRQFYRSCRIEGNVDFIFGNSAAIFQDCTILVCPRLVNPEKGEKNAITAHGRTDPAQTTGFVFQNCVVNGTEEYMRLYRSKQKAHKNFLGRPWKEYSRTLFIRCNLEALIMPQGWLPWKGDFALKTLYYGEFQNFGPGSPSNSSSSQSQRVSWSSQIPAEHVYTSYSVENFIQGDEWIPSSS